jgi:excisionase family DNA binding protein
VNSCETINRSDYLSVTDLSRMLACGRAAVYSLLSRGELRYVKIGSQFRISRQSVEEFLNRKNVSTE